MKIRLRQPSFPWGNTLFGQHLIQHFIVNLVRCCESAKCLHVLHSVKAKKSIPSLMIALFDYLERLTSRLRPSGSTGNAALGCFDCNSIG